MATSSMSHDYNSKDNSESQHPRYSETAPDTSLSTAETTLLWLLKLCYKHHLHLVALKPNTKEPAYSGWQKRVLTPKQLRKYVVKGYNWAIVVREGMVVVDLDSEEMVEKYDHQLPPELPRVKTRRGRHVWVKTGETWPFATQAEKGVDLLGEGHLAVIPPSVHPTGSVYQWIVQPNGNYPRTDLGKLFGINRKELVEGKQKAANFHYSSTGSNYGPPASPEEQAVFEELFSDQGIHREGSEESFHLCPFHSETKPSLHITWGRTLYYCFGCQKGGNVNMLDAELHPLKAECPNYSLQETATGESNWDIPLNLFPVPTPFDEWGLDPLCGYNVNMRHKANRQEHRTRHLPCKRWRCPECKDSLSAQWRKHLSPLLEAAETLFLSFVAKEKWKSFRKQLHRHSAEYARIELWKDSFAVFSTAYGEHEVQPYDKDGLPQRDGLLLKALQCATAEHKAVTTSRGWKLPQEVSEWEQTGKVKSIEESVAVCQQLGIEVKGYQPDFPSLGFDYSLPKSWGEETVQRFYRCLKLGKVTEDWEVTP